MTRRTTRILLSALLVTAGVGSVLAAQSVDVNQKGKMFSQQRVTLKVGDKIRFVNNDTVTHNVFATGERFSFNLRRQAPGTATMVSFPREGSYLCRCAIHPNMRLEVKVVK